MISAVHTIWMLLVVFEPGAPTTLVQVHDKQDCLRLSQNFKDIPNVQTFCFPTKTTRHLAEVGE